MKALQLLDILTTIIKQNDDIFSEVFFANFNQLLESYLFPEKFECPYVRPVFMKNSLTVKENYRLVSILSNISETNERCLYLDVIF